MHRSRRLQLGTEVFLRRRLDVVGFCAELAHPADQRAESIGDGSVLLSRDDDGVLRVRQLLPAPRPRVAAVRRIRSAPEHRVPVPLPDLCARRQPEDRQGLQGNGRFRRLTVEPGRTAVTKWHGLSAILSRKRATDSGCAGYGARREAMRAVRRAADWRDCRQGDARSLTVRWRRRVSTGCDGCAWALRSPAARCSGRNPMLT
jgi:hypothetical protein